MGEIFKTFACFQVYRVASYNPQSLFQRLAYKVNDKNYWRNRLLFSVQREGLGAIRGDDHVFEERHATTTG